MDYRSETFSQHIIKNNEKKYARSLWSYYFIWYLRKIFIRNLGKQYYIVFITVKLTRWNYIAKTIYEGWSLHLPLVVCHFYMFTYKYILYVTDYNEMYAKLHLLHHDEDLTSLNHSFIAHEMKAIWLWLRV